VLGDKKETGETFSEAFNYIAAKIGFKFQAGKLAVLIPDRKWNWAVKYCHTYIQDYVTKAIEHRKSIDSKQSEEDPERYIFLNELAKTGRNEKKLRDELFNILLAGRDTTASFLGFFWYLIARRPDVWDKLQEEVSVLDGARPTAEQLRQMKYLTCVINESQYNSISPFRV